MMIQRFCMKGLGTLAMLAGASISAFAGPVALQNATATFSQTIGASFPASSMIDGSFGVALGQGWAIFDGSGTGAQTAVFETVTDAGFAGGTTFTFTLSHLYTGAATAHTLGRFRISVTTDARSTFADGLQSGGDVTAAWTVLTPGSATGTNGPTLTVQGDGSVLASGTNPVNSVYTVTASTLLTGITGIRLEAMTDPSLPTQGPGREPSNGNFVLTEFQADAVSTPLPEPSTLALAALGGALLWLRRRHQS